MPCEELVQKAYQHILRNDFLSAIAAFKKALSICPEEAEIYYLLSISYSRSHMLKEALRAAQKAVDLKSNSEDFLAQLQHIQAMSIHLEALEIAKNKDMLRLAERLLKQSIELDPVYIQAYVDLGNVYRDQGKYELARTVYQQALDLVPGHLEVKLRMIEITPLLEP